MLLATVVLAAFGRDAIDIYYNIYIIGALVVTELHAYMNQKARHGLNLVGALLVSIFLVIVAIKVIKL